MKSLRANCSLNLGSTELIQQLGQVQILVQHIWVAPQIYELVQLNLSLTHDLCRSPNFTNSYWLNKHVC